MKLAVKLSLLAALAAAAGSGFTQHRANQREAATEAAYPPEGQFVDLDGQRVHYVEAGSGPDLILIHGASGSTRDMTSALMPSLTDRYRVIAFDRPGLGYTDRSDPKYDSAFTNEAESPLEQARMLQEAAAALGADKPIVMGHSFGGTVALAWALERPDNIAALVAVSAPSNPWPGDLGLLYKVAGSRVGGAVLPPLISAFATQDRIDETIGSIFTPQNAPGGYSDAVGAALIIRRDSYRANARQVNGLRPHVVEMAPRYGTITAPTEILHGDTDDVVPLHIHSALLVNQIPESHLVVLPGMGHMPHHVATDAVGAAIDRAAVRAGLR